METLPYLYLRGNTDYVIIGTGAVSELSDHYTCGELREVGFVRMMAFYFGIEEIYRLTGIRYSTLFIDTCYAQLHTTSIVTQLFNSSTHANVIDQNGVSQRIQYEKLAVIVGDQSSSVSIVLQDLIRLLNITIPQISYSSTSVWLSDRLRYPFFLRTVPSDSAQADIILQLCAKLGITRIGLIYSNSVYGVTGSNLIIKRAPQYGICVDFTAVLDRDNIKSTAVNIMTDKDLPRVFVLFTERDLIKPLLDRMDSTFVDGEWAQRGNLFIATETWGSSQDIITRDEGKTLRAAYGAITVALSSSISSVDYFKDYVSKQKPENNLNNYWFYRFWQKHFECNLIRFSVHKHDALCDTTCDIADPMNTCGKPDIEYQDTYTKYLISVMYSLGYAILDARTEGLCHINCTDLLGTDRTEFIRLIKEARIPTTIGGRQRRFNPYDSNGDGRPDYAIYSIVKGDTNAKYDQFATVTNGELVMDTYPTFYKRDQRDTDFSSDPNIIGQCLADPSSPYTGPISLRIKLRLAGVSISFLFIGLIAGAILIFQCSHRRNTGIMVQRAELGNSSQTANCNPGFANDDRLERVKMEEGPTGRPDHGPFPNGTGSSCSQLKTVASVNTLPPSSTNARHIPHNEVSCVPTNSIHSRFPSTDSGSNSIHSRLPSTDSGSNSIHSRLLSTDSGSLSLNTIQSLVTPPPSQPADETSV